MSYDKNKNKSVNKGGRPPKFTEKSVPITVTLPVSTLKLLECVDQDRAKAIFKVTNTATKTDDSAQSLVQITEVEKGVGIIIVGPSKYLKRISNLRLIEILPTRYLLVTPTGTSATALEVAILDLLQELPEDETYEKDLLTELSKCLATQRRNQTITREELLLISMT